MKSAQKKGSAAVKQNVKAAKAKGAKLKSIAKAKGAELKVIAKSGYDQLKKEMNISPSEAKKMEQKAIKEYEKVKKQMEATAKKAETYMKKNPGKAAAISAGIGAALAGAAALMFSGKEDKKNKKKK